MTEFLLHQRAGPRRGCKVNPSVPSYSGKGLVPGKGGTVRAAGLREGRGPSGGPPPPPPPRLPARGSCAARVEHSRYPPTLCPWRARPAPTSVMPGSPSAGPAERGKEGYLLPSLDRSPPTQPAVAAGCLCACCDRHQPTVLSLSCSLRHRRERPGCSGLLYFAPERAVGPPQASP